MTAPCPCMVCGDQVMCADCREWNRANGSPDQFGTTPFEFDSDG